MNKKVLSAILFSALFAGTGTFTSCIDTDEPAGIEELRGAKAELLRAKVAVEQAEAALTLAKAETEKALALKGQAEAKIKEAEARIKEAQAAAEEAETEALKAEYAKNAAFWQQEMAEAALEHEASILELKGTLAEAQRTYELTLVKIAVAKKLCPLDSAFTLDALETSVKNWTAKVDSLGGVVAGKQEIYDSLATDYKYYGKFDSDSLQIELDRANLSLVSLKSSLAEYENWLEEDVATKDWRAEVDKLTAQIDSLNKYEANIELDSALAVNSTEYRDLLAAQTEASKDALVDSVYGFKYYGDDYASTLYLSEVVGVDTASVISNGTQEIPEEAAKKALVVEALDTIAQYDVTTGALKGGKLYYDKKHLASFTAEVKHFLDTIAAKKAETDTIFEYNSNLAIKAWADTLAMYKNADATVATKWTAVESAYNAITDNTKAASYATFRTKLIAYYTAAIANGAKLNKVPVQVKDAVYDAAKDSMYQTSVTSLVDMMTALNDATNGNANVKFLFDEGMDLSNFCDTTLVASDTIKYVKADGKAGELAFYPKAFSKLPMSKDDMYNALVRASDHAFGKAELYHQVDGGYVGSHAPTTPCDESKFLHVQPDSVDVLNIAFFNKYDNDNDIHTAVSGATSGKLGEYGKYLIAKSDLVKDYANNYESIIENLEAAIAYWEATYTTLNAKYTAWEAAKKAADEAVITYKKANIDSTADKLEELGAEITRLGEIKEALQIAIKVYLPGTMSTDANVQYEAAEAFKVALDGIIATQKMAVNRAERTVAKWQKAVELNEYDLYSDLAEAEIDLNDAIAELKDAQAELEKALANIAEALEIYEATVAE